MLAKSTAINKRKVFDLTKYVLKRLAYVVIVFLIVSFLMYCLFGLMQGDAARAQLEKARLTMKPEAYEAAYQALREELGLNEHLFVRYARWMGFMPEKASGVFNGILQGNLGYSQTYGRYCTDVIKAPIVNTMLFNIFATILTLGITIPLGIWCAVHRNSKMDQGVQAFTIIGYSIPQYIIGLLFIFVFAVLLRWFPVNGAATPGANYTGFREFADRMYYLALPIIVSTFSGLGGMSRYVRAAMIDALSMDCIRTARAKGVKERVVIYSHAWRNALLPVVTSIIGWFLGIFSGSIVLERMFSLNGMGKLYIDALNAKDIELCLTIQLFYVVVALLGNLATDLVYGVVDPRVRVNK